jgi:mannosyltransferase
MPSQAEKDERVHADKYLPITYVAIWFTVLLIAAFLRFASLSEQSLWSDEIQTIEIARGSLSEVALTAAQTNIQPPLFFWLVRAMAAFGSNEFNIRLPSAIAGLLTVPLVWAIAAQMTSRFTSIIVMLTIAISPFHIWYSQEARGYALLLFFLTASVSCLLAWWRGVKQARLGYLISTVLALYTHILALPFLAVQLVVAYFFSKHPPCSSPDSIAALTFYRFIQTLAAALLFLIPGLVILFRHSYVLYLLPPFSLVLEGPAKVSMLMIAVGVLYSLYALVAGFSLGPSSRELHTVMGFGDLTAYVTPQVVIFWIVLGILLLRGIVVAYRQRVMRITVLGWLVLILVLSAGAAFWAEAVLYPRFLIAATPPVCLLLGLGIASQPTLSRKLLALIAFMTATALPLQNALTDLRYAKEDMRSAEQYLSSVAAEGDIVVVSTGYMRNVLTYYCDRSGACKADLIPYPADHRWTNAEQISEDVPKLIAGKTRVWLLLSRTFHSDPQGLLLEYFRSNNVIDVRGSWSGVTLYEVKQRPG